MSAGVVAHALWTKAAPAMAYRLYAAEWHFSQTATTMIFALYPAAVVAALVGFGDISDHIGRRATILAGTRRLARREHTLRDSQLPDEGQGC